MKVLDLESNTSTSFISEFMTVYSLYGHEFLIPTGFKWITIDRCGDVYVWYNKPTWGEDSGIWVDKTKQYASFHNNWIYVGCYVCGDEEVLLDDAGYALFLIKDNYV